MPSLESMDLLTIWRRVIICIKRILMINTNSVLVITVKRIVSWWCQSVTEMSHSWVNESVYSPGGVVTDWQAPACLLCAAGACLYMHFFLQHSLCLFVWLPRKVLNYSLFFWSTITSVYISRISIIKQFLCINITCSVILYLWCITHTLRLF